MNENYDRLKTASRLKNWIACNYTTINEINKKDLKKKQSSTTEKIRKERGDEFEEKIYKKLIKQYPKHIKIEKDGDQFEKTKEALKKGYDLIHKAHFKHKGWVGEIDFLIKDQNKKTKKGKMFYEIAPDVNSNRPEGQGIEYEGEIFFDQPHGKGTMTFEDGSKRTAVWDNGDTDWN